MNFPKLKPINLSKVFIEISRNVIRELSGLVRNNIEVDGNRYPPLKSTRNNKMQSRALLKVSKRLKGGQDLNRTTRMYDKGDFARNAFEFKVEGAGADVISRVFLSKKDHYSGETYENVGVRNMGEDPAIRKSMGRMMFLFPQTDAHIDNLLAWQRGEKKIIDEFENQLEKNLEMNIKQTIFI